MWENVNVVERYHEEKYIGKIQKDSPEMIKHHIRFLGSSLVKHIKKDYEVCWEKGSAMAGQEDS